MKERELPTLGGRFDQGRHHIMVFERDKRDNLHYRQFSGRLYDWVTQNATEAGLLQPTEQIRHLEESGKVCVMFSLIISSQQ
jgi:hypothetical protein